MTKDEAVAWATQYAAQSLVYEYLNLERATITSEAMTILTGKEWKVHKSSLKDLYCVYPGATICRIDADRETC